MKHTKGTWIVFHSKIEGIWIDPIGLRVDDCRAKEHAHLIAAAPDMLEALESVLTEQLTHGDYGDAELISKLTRVVSKAKGQL